MARRRRVFLINQPFQFRFSLYVCSWIFALSLLYPMLIYNIFDFLLQRAAVDPHGPEVQILQGKREELIQYLVILQVLFVAIVFLMSVFLSHRIAGPLHKLKQFFEKARNGDTFSTLAFRKHDHFQDVAQSYNEMMAGLRKIWNQRLDTLESQLNAAAAGDKKSMDRALETLREIRKDS